jgi:hypothetical protein
VRKIITGPKNTFTLERSSAVVDSMGSYTTTWATVCTIKGVFCSESGNEVVERDKDTVVVSHKLICDLQTTTNTPTEKDRLLDCNSKVYEILYVDSPQSKHLEIKLVQRTT